jgi:uncharacterized protein (TIGR00369 family)
MTQTQPDLATLDGMEQLMLIFDGVLPPPPIAETLGMVDFGGERGAISVGLDTAAACSVHSTLEPGERYTSLDLTVKFLRPVTVESGRLRAVGKVVQRGRRTSLAEAQVFDAADRLVAHATSTCMVFPPAG